MHYLAAGPATKADTHSVMAFLHTSGGLIISLIAAVWVIGWIATHTGNARKASS